MNKPFNTISMKISTLYNKTALIWTKFEFFLTDLFLKIIYSILKIINYLLGIQNLTCNINNNHACPHLGMAIGGKYGSLLNLIIEGGKLYETIKKEEAPSKKRVSSSITQMLRNGLVVTLVILLVNNQNAIAQDLHFSQFYNAPLLANPANTGFTPDADYRIGGNYRNQWATIPVPYKTMSFYGDAQLAADKLQNGWIGVGAIMLRDEAGDGALKSIKTYGNIAYHQQLSETRLLSLGVQAGYIQKSINTNKLTFDDQWNGKFFDINVPNNEALLTNQISYLDINIGLNYAAFPNENTYINGGIAVQHINRPKETFFSNTFVAGKDYDNRLARRYTAFANASIKLNDKVIVNPQAYFTYMEKANQLNVGGNIHYNLGTMDYASASELIAGVYYRYKDAAIPMLGIKHKNLTATFTYDATISKLTPYNQTRGANEISIIYSGLYNRGGKTPRNMRCAMPSF